MAVIEAKGARSKISQAGFALKDAEFPVEVADVMKSLFYEARGGFAVLVGAMSGYVVHERAISKKQIELYLKLTPIEV